MERVLDKFIEVTPGVRGGKPRIAGHRITVSDIVLMHNRMDMPPEEIAGMYNLSLAAVYAALAYYYDHRGDVDRQIAEEEALAAAFREKNPSLLQKKLRSLKRG